MRGQLFLNADFYAWVVDGSKQLAGWPLHRDRSVMQFYRCNAHTLPEYVTCWMALTEATLGKKWAARLCPHVRCSDNGCVSVLPRPDDPLYDRLQEDTDDEQPAASDIALVPLPVPAGDVLCWTGAWKNRCRARSRLHSAAGRLLHQGGAFNNDVEPRPHARIALATAFSTVRCVVSPVVVWMAWLMCRALFNSTFSLSLSLSSLSFFLRFHSVFLSLPPCINHSHLVKADQKFNSSCVCSCCGVVAKLDIYVRVCVCMHVCVCIRHACLPPLPSFVCLT